MKEVWKDIQGYGIYEVSNLGNVRNKITNKQLYYSNSNSGYLRVGLFKEHKRTMYSIHRLVAEAFIDNPNNLPCVNHKDCDKKNNKVDNLEWCTYKENNSYKNHNLKRKLSSALFELRKNYPNEKDIINKLQKVRKEIDRL